jgi:hypothetical protein
MFWREISQVCSEPNILVWRRQRTFTVLKSVLCKLRLCWITITRLLPFYFIYNVKCPLIQSCTPVSSSQTCHIIPKSIISHPAILAPKSSHLYSSRKQSRYLATEIAPSNSKRSICVKNISQFPGIRNFLNPNMQIMSDGQASVTYPLCINACSSEKLRWIKSL